MEPDRPESEEEVAPPLACGQLEVARPHDELRARSVAMAGAFGVVVAMVATASGALEAIGFPIGTLAAAIHLGATMKAASAMRASRPTAVGPGVLRWHPDQSVGLLLDGSDAAQHPGAPGHPGDADEPHRWVAGWFDGTRLGLSLDDGTEVVATPRDPARAREVWRRLEMPRGTFERTLRGATPGQWLWRALLLPYALGLLLVVLTWLAWTAFLVLVLTALSGPIGVAVAVALAATLLAGTWRGARAIWHLRTRLVDTRLVVGRDGVSIRRRGTSSQLLRHESVRSYQARKDQVVVELADGAAVELRAGTEEAAASVARCIEELRSELAGAADPEGAPGGELERGARPTGEWLARLRKLTRGDEHAAYRIAAVDPERLVRHLDHPGASVEQRLGAAVALGASGDAQLARRVRVAAAGHADDAMRTALEHAAAGELEEDEAAHLLRASTPRARARS